MVRRYLITFTLIIAIPTFCILVFFFQVFETTLIENLSEQSLEAVSQMAQGLNEEANLSCHNDFLLVRQAFRLGVHDYILKTEMEPDNMLAHLKEIVSRLRVSKKQPFQLAPLSPVEKKYLRRQFLKNLLNGQVDRDISKKTKRFDIRVREDGTICVCAVTIKTFDIVRRRYSEDQMHVFVENVVNSIAQILSRKPYGEIVSLDEESYVVFFSFDEAKKECTPKVYEILQEIKQSLQHYLDFAFYQGKVRLSYSCSS